MQIPIEDLRLSCVCTFAMASAANLRSRGEFELDMVKTGEIRVVGPCMARPSHLEVAGKRRVFHASHVAANHAVLRHRQIPRSPLAFAMR